MRKFESFRDKQIFLKIPYTISFNYLKRRNFRRQKISRVSLNQVKMDTLGVQTFARTNFREFREFWPHSRKFIFAKNPKSLIRESLYSRKKRNYWFAKVYFREKSSNFENVKIMVRFVPFNWHYRRWTKYVN